MEFRSKFMPIVLSGTLALGTMGAPLSAFAQVVDKYDTEKVKAQYVSDDLEKRVEAGDISQDKADAILAKFKAVVKAENEAAEAKLQEQLAVQAAEEQAEAEAEEQAAAETQEQAEAAAEESTDSGETAGDAGEGAEDPAGPADEPGEPENPDNPDPSDPENPDDPNPADDPADGPTDPEEPGTPDDPAVKPGEDSGKDAAGSEGTEDADTAKDDAEAKPAKPAKHAKDADADAQKDDADADKAAEEKAAKGKHAKKTAEQKAKEQAQRQQQAAREFAEQARQQAEKDAAEAVASSDVYASAYSASNQGYTRIKYTANLSTEMFIASIGEQARQIGQDKSLYASVMIAQAVIESDSGNSGLARAPYNNLFGIKGAHEGNSVTMSTQEDNGSGSLYTIDAAFRAYDTQSESLEDYAELLRGDMSHYYNAWKENADTYEDAAKALQGTYATSTVYADTICAVIEAYDLTRYDEPLAFELTGKNADGKTLTMADYAKLQANAVSFLGTPYVWGGTSPDGFDCSGFVQYLYQETFGIDLPRTTYTMQYEGEEVSFDDLQMGDLLFFAGGGSTDHVAMYLGDGFYIHAPEPGDAIKIADMESFKPTFAKRVLQEKAVDAEASGKAAAEDAPTADEADEAPVEA